MYSWELSTEGRDLSFAYAFSVCFGWFLVSFGWYFVCFGWPLVCFGLSFVWFGLIETPKLKWGLLLQFQ
jgi:hypothetical protein